MDVRPRSVHLVGSIPAADTTQAMADALSMLGPFLRSLPDGETGERRNWIVHIVEALAHHPDLEVYRAGDWSGYERAARLRVRRGHSLCGETLDFGHVAAFEASLPILKRLRAQYGRDDLALQVGIPGDLDMALFALGPSRAFRYREAFRAATMREIRAIHDRAGSQVLFQVEVPAELVWIAQLPPPLRPIMARWLAAGVARLARLSPAGARFGVHLCLGDLGNRALGQLKDAAPLVSLANALVRTWPPGRPLEYIHAPFAAGQHPAPLEVAFYRPLSRLVLPADVRFVAGFVHERRDRAQLRQTLAEIERSVGRRVDVAAACGLGRRTPEAARRNMELAATLTSD